MVIRLIKNINEERKTFKSINVNADCKWKKTGIERCMILKEERYEGGGMVKLYYCLKGMSFKGKLRIQKKSNKRRRGFKVHMWQIVSAHKFKQIIV